VSPRACDNCGAPDEAPVEVHRVYLVPEPTVVDEVEAWCAACRSQYPHETVV
jgi:hypothetical protein